MPSARCCFLHVFYIAGNQYQTESKRSETPGGFFWARRKPVGQESTRGAARGEQHPEGRARRLRCALVGAAPSRLPSGAFLAHWISFVPKKSSKSFVAFGLHLILISRDVKNMQKTATCTAHYVNRLVQKNDIK